MSEGTAASSKVWRRMGALSRDALLRGLSPVELRAILADVARVRAGRLNAADLMKRWREDRFLRPSAVDPRASLALQRELWHALPKEFVGVELSPLTSLASASHLTGVGQNRVITTMRGTELVSDATQPLALEASRLRRSGHARVHLAACCRIDHAWDAQPDAPAHATQFALASSSPDGGGLGTEADLLDLHLDYWREVIGRFVPAGRVQLVVWDAALAAVLEQRGTRDDLIVVAAPTRTPFRNPYSTAAFRFVGGAGDAEPVDLGDGGFVGWTQLLTRNRKDRCLVSSIGVDALLALQ